MIRIHIPAFVIYYVIEYTTEEDKILSERELHWMKQLDSLNRDKGYNLRYDSDTKCYCSEETKKKISNRIKQEFKDGIRSSKKVSEQKRKKETRSKLYLALLLINNVIFLFCVALILAPNPLMFLDQHHI